MASLVCGACGRQYTTNKPPTPGKTHRCAACGGVLGLAPEGPEVSAAPVAPSPVTAPLPSPPPPAAPPAPAGPQLIVPEVRPFGKYRIVRVLGRGGMGVVYEALDPESGRRVALKTLLSRPSEMRKDEERFSREIRLSGALPPHPNIVSVYDTGVIDGKRYLAMEYVEGTSFDRWRETRRGAAREQATVLRDVARAVQHAHAHGIMHRDLKPQNILVDAAGRSHVTDFGLAKTVGGEAGVDLTAAGLAIGSPTYMSPEQARGLKSVDGRTDVWSLGVMLYEALAGRAPFVGKSAIQILQQAVREPPPPAARLAKESCLPSPDPALEAVCLRALAKKAEERHATAGALADDLDRWLEGKAVAMPAAAGDAAPAAPAAGPDARPAWWRRLLAWIRRRRG